MPRKTWPAAACWRRCRACFNEAAARCHGKHAARAIYKSYADVASMRPRPDATENVQNSRIHSRNSGGLQ